MAKKTRPASQDGTRGAVTGLLSGAMGGNRQAQDTLRRLIEPELRRIALHRLRRLAGREDVRTTEVIDAAFLKVMRLDRHFAHRGQFYAFVSRNMYSVWVDLLRRMERDLRQREGDQPLLESLPERPKGLTHASLDALQRALDQLAVALSPEHRQIVEMKYFNECTLDGIAEATGIPRSTVDRKLKVALAFLRGRLKDDLPGFGGDANSAPDEQ